MSEEIVKYDDSYLSTLREGSRDEVEDLAGEVNPLDLMPRLILPRDGTRDLKCTLGEDTLFTRKKITAIVLWAGARRTLWRPEGSETEDNMPVCSTGVQRISTFHRRNDTGIGRWIVSGNEHLPGPFGDSPEGLEDVNGTAEVSCSGCMFNEFGSTPHWDLSKEGDAGKACNEGRVLALRVVDKVSSFATSTGDEVGLYSHTGDGPILLCNLSATSIKTVRKMAAAAVSRQIALSRLVWSMGAEIKENGSIQWSVLDVNLVGYPVKEILDNIDRDRDVVMSLFEVGGGGIIDVSGDDQVLP